MDDTVDFPEMTSSTSRGQTFEASASTIWTVLFFAYSSSTFVSEFGHGWFASWTILFVLIPVTMAGLPNILEHRPNAIPILISYYLYVLAPPLLQLTKPSDYTSYGSELFDLATVLAIWLPLELKLLNKKLSPTGKVDVWGLLTAALTILNTFTVLRPFSHLEHARDLGYTFKLSLTDVLISVTLSLVQVALAVPFALQVGFAKWRQHFTLKQKPSREVAAFMGMYMSALTEELLFRGLIQNMLEQRTSRNSIGALIGASLLFGVAHVSKKKLGWAPPNLRFAACACISGIVSGIVWRVTSKVTASAITHATSDYLLYRILLADGVQL